MHNRSLIRVSRQIFNTPVLVTEEWASVLLSAARSELNVNLITRTDGVEIDRMGMERMARAAREAVDVREDQRYRGDVNQVTNGIAVIPIEGTLTKSWGLDPYSGFTGYDGIKAKLIAAIEDNDVEAIMLDIDSPGGAVSGCFDLVDLIYALREDNAKPIGAIANEMACSAAYAIFSAATPGFRFVPRTGEIGSIGVLMMHTDVQKALQMEGIEVRIFRAGKWKAEGNAYEDMEKETAQRIQDSLDEIRDLFVNTVARNVARPGDDVGALKKTIRETEGLTYIGRHARDIGLADEVGSEDQLWARLLEKLGR